MVQIVLWCIISFRRKLVAQSLFKIFLSLWFFSESCKSLFAFFWSNNSSLSRFFILILQYLIVKPRISTLIKSHFNPRSSTLSYFSLYSRMFSRSLFNNNNNNNTLFNHATFRSEKRSLKHVRAKTMYTINTIQYIQFIKNIYN